MKLFNMYKKILSFFLIVPISSYGNSIKLELSNEMDNFPIMFKATDNLVVDIGNSELIITHESIQEMFEKEFSINIYDEESLRVEFHEESNTLDFSTLDGVSVGVPLSKVSGAPPNGIGS